LECARLQIFDQVELYFIRKEKQGDCYKKGDYEIVTKDYNVGIQLYLTAIGHKYHDKSMSTQKIPFLLYRNTRIYDGKEEKIRFPNGFEKKTSYYAETYKSLLEPGQEYSQLYLEMFQAIDRYFSTSLVRQYLRKEGKDSGMSVVKFTTDFSTDPSSLTHLCPMIRLYKGKIYWWMYKHILTDSQLINILWSASDSGFEYERMSNGLLMAYRVVDYDMKLIEQKFMCPLTGRMLLDPLVSKAGKTYDRIALMEYTRIHGTDPETGEVAYMSDLRNNDTLKEIANLMYLGIYGETFLEKSIIGDD
jgi:hypothetical protein